MKERPFPTNPFPSSRDEFSTLSLPERSRLRTLYRKTIISIAESSSIKSVHVFEMLRNMAIDSGNYMSYVFETPEIPDEEKQKLISIAKLPFVQSVEKSGILRDLIGAPHDRILLSHTARKRENLRRGTPIPDELSDEIASLRRKDEHISLKPITDERTFFENLSKLIQHFSLDQEMVLSFLEAYTSDDPGEKIRFLIEKTNTQEQQDQLVTLATKLDLKLLKRNGLLKQWLH